MLLAMALTRDERSKQDLCGAKRRNGEPCRLFAGQGTSHKGTGACKHHGGSTQNHNKRAIKQELTQRMVQEATMGEPVEEITAVQALAQRVWELVLQCCD